MEDISPRLLQMLVIGTLLSMPFKAMGLWKAARGEQKGWFGAMLLVNSLGLIELIYLFYFSTPKPKS